MWNRELDLQLTHQLRHQLVTYGAVKAAATSGEPEKPLLRDATEHDKLSAQRMATIAATIVPKVGMPGIQSSPSLGTA